MKQLLLKLYRTVIDTIILVSNFAKQLLIWLNEAWSGTWREIFEFLKKGLWLLFDRRIWVVMLLVTAIWVIVVGPNVIEQVPHVDEWQATPCSFRGIYIVVNSPMFIAPNDQRHFEITIQNENSQPLHNINVAIRSIDGSVFFEGNSVVTTEELGGNQSATKLLNFRIANLWAIREISTVVFVSAKIAEEIVSFQCPAAPVLKNSPWRRVIVVFNAIPSIIDAIAKYIGYVGTLIAGLITLRGQLATVVKATVDALKNQKDRTRSPISNQNIQSKPPFVQ